MSCCNKPIRTELVTPPAELPIDRDNVKLHARIDTANTSLNSLIDEYIPVAVLAGQAWTGLTFVKITYRAYYNLFGPALVLLGRPEMVVNSVKYKLGGSLLTLDPAQYVVNLEENGAFIVPVTTWPDLDSDVSDRVQVEYDLGWANANEVPPDIKVGLKQLVVLMLDNPGDCCIPENCMHKTLLNNYRKFTVRGGSCGL